MWSERVSGAPEQRGSAGGPPVEVRRFARWQRPCDWLTVRARVLAERFGACRCWGVDRGCPRCGGRGAPGWQPPAR
jgi:hypothetical protein